jgi:ankyrin repeat protein
MQQKVSQQQEILRSLHKPATRFDALAQLMRAGCQKGDIQTVTYCLDNNIRVDYQYIDASSNTPLIIALQNRQCGLAEELLRRRASAYKSNNVQDSPAHFAAELIVAALQEKNEVLEKQARSIYRNIIAQGTNQNQRGRSGQTPTDILIAGDAL